MAPFIFLGMLFISLFLTKDAEKMTLLMYPRCRVILGLHNGVRHYLKNAVTLARHRLKNHCSIQYEAIQGREQSVLNINFT